MSNKSIQRVLHLAIVLSIAMSFIIQNGVIASRAAQAIDLDIRLAAVQSQIQRSLDQFRKALAQPNPTPTVRDFSNAALFVLISGSDAREAEDYLTRAFAAQNMDASSLNYGQVPWQVGHPEIVDANADEFTNQAIGPILLGYQNRLSADFLTQLRPHLTAALAVVARRNVPVSYTNIYLMQTVDLLLIGRALNDTRATTEGAAHLESWLAYTVQNGIHEFDSPTYYGADLDSLISGYLYTNDPTIKAKLKRVLDYFWTDLTANYFAGRQSLSGPHSRDYDFLTGTGEIDLYYYVEGVIPDLRFGALDFEKTYLLEQGAAGAYHPSAAILAVAQEATRWITQRYGDQVGMDRANYITPDFAIGSASSSYNAQDKMISVELAGGANFPALTLVADDHDAPWGKVKSLDSSGHSKPTHLPLNPTAVQDKNVVLALLNLNLSGKIMNSDVGTNLVLPAQADQITIDRQRIDTSKPFKQIIDPTSEVTLGVLEGQGAAVFRFFHWDDCNSAVGQTVLQADKDGLKYGALRLTHYHGCQDISSKTAPHLRVGVLIVARHVETADQFQQLVTNVQTASITDQTSETDWSVSAIFDNEALTISRSIITGMILSRTVNGKSLEIPVFAINGVTQPLTSP